MDLIVCEEPEKQAKEKYGKLNQYARECLSFFLFGKSSSEELGWPISSKSLFLCLGLL